MTKDGKTAFLVDNYASMSINGETFSQTVQSTECELLFHNANIANHIGDICESVIHAGLWI